jgi:hypothetical protein
MQQKSEISKKIITENFFNVCISDIDTFPYCNILNELSKECNNITELVTIPPDDKITFTWCMLNGLTSNKNDISKSFRSIWLDKVNTKIYYPDDISKYCGVNFEVMVRPSTLDIGEIADMIFIHTDRTFDTLSETILSIQNRVRKYIVINDNKFVSNMRDDLLKNDTANLTYVEDTIMSFLQNNHNWSIVRGYETEYRMTVLKRLED